MPKHMTVGYATTSPLALIEVQGKDAQELCGMHDLQPSDPSEIVDQLRTINPEAFCKFSDEEVDDVLFGAAPEKSAPPRAGAGLRAKHRQAFITSPVADPCLAIGARHVKTSVSKDVLTPSPAVPPETTEDSPEPVKDFPLKPTDTAEASGTTPQSEEGETPIGGRKSSLTTSRLNLSSGASGPSWRSTNPCSRASLGPSKSPSITSS